VTAVWLKVDSYSLQVDAEAPTALHASKDNFSFVLNGRPSGAGLPCCVAEDRIASRGRLQS